MPGVPIPYMRPLLSALQLLCCVALATPTNDGSPSSTPAGPLAPLWTVPLSAMQAMELELGLPVHRNETIGKYNINTAGWHHSGQVKVFCRLTTSQGSFIGTVALDGWGQDRASWALGAGAVVVTNATRAYIFSWPHIEACLPRNDAYGACAAAHRERYMGYSDSETQLSKTVAVVACGCLALSSALFFLRSILQDLHHCTPAEPDSAFVIAQEYERGSGRSRRSTSALLARIKRARGSIHASAPGSVGSAAVAQEVSTTGERVAALTVSVEVRPLEMSVACAGATTD
jgi:hypothetical protein